MNKPVQWTEERWLEFLGRIKEVYEEFNFNPEDLPVEGQTEVEEEIKERNNNPHIRTFDADTHGTQAFYQEFKKTGNMKLLWARMSGAVREYQLSPEAVAEIAPDRCPVTGALIDYGYGRNQVTENVYFRPGIDHKEAVNNGGKKFGDINNIRIVSQHYNTIKSFGTIIEAIKWVGHDLK
jgi:hypothetical protein